MTRKWKATMIIYSVYFGTFSNSQWGISSCMVMDVMICIESITYIFGDQAFSAFIHHNNLMFDLDNIQWCMLWLHDLHVAWLLGYFDVTWLHGCILCGLLLCDISSICKKCCCVVAHHYTLDINLESPMDYQLSLLSKVFSLLS